MPRVHIKYYKLPNTCGKCKFIGRYKDGPYVRNPHCCCELLWQLEEEEHRVREDTLYDECPLKNLTD